LYLGCQYDFIFLSDENEPEDTSKCDIQPENLAVEGMIVETYSNVDENIESEFTVKTDGSCLQDEDNQQQQFEIEEEPIEEVEEVADDIIIDRQMCDNQVWEL
jgi:hypothetical protein